MIISQRVQLDTNWYKLYNTISNYTIMSSKLSLCNIVILVYYSVYMCWIETLNMHSTLTRISRNSTYIHIQQTYIASPSPPPRLFSPSSVWSTFSSIFKPSLLNAYLTISRFSSLFVSLSRASDKLFASQGRRVLSEQLPKHNALIVFTYNCIYCRAGCMS